MFSEGRKPVNSCAWVPRAAGLLAGSHTSQDQSWDPLWETTVWSQGLLCVWEFRSQGWECLQSCQRKATTGNSLGMGTPTYMSWCHLQVCLQNIPALFLCSLGWLCEDSCVLSLVVFWEYLNHFSELLGYLWVRLIFCASIYLSWSFGAGNGQLWVMCFPIPLCTPIFILHFWKYQKPPILSPFLAVIQWINPVSSLHTRTLSLPLFWRPFHCLGLV